MDSAFGIVGDGFVIVAADRTALRQPLNFKHDEEKVVKIDDSQVMAATGENCDRVAFTEYVVRNMTLDRYRSRLQRSVKATAYMVRGELAKALRKAPFNVNLLLAGVDIPAAKEGEDATTTAAAAAAAAKEAPAAATPSLYWIDYMGTMAKVNYGCHGYAAFFTGGLLDKDWREGMNEAQVLDLLGKCIAETRMRFMLNQPAYSCYKVDASGVTPIDIAAHIPVVPDVADVPVVRAAGVGAMAAASSISAATVSASSSD